MDILFQVNVMLLPLEGKGFKDDVFDLRFRERGLVPWEHIRVTNEGSHTFNMVLRADRFGFVTVLGSEILEHGVTGIRLTVFSYERRLAGFETSWSAAIARGVLIIDNNLPFGERGVG